MGELRLKQEGMDDAYSGLKTVPNVLVVYVLEPLRRLWCKVTLQSRLVLELQRIDSQARISKNRGSRLSKSEGSGHLLVQVFRQKKGMH